VRYSTGEQETEYVAVCLPAFAPELAHRADEAERPGGRPGGEQQSRHG
jgi:hypothetical protein